MRALRCSECVRRSAAAATPFDESRTAVVRQLRAIGRTPQVNEELTVYDRLTEQRFDHELGVSLDLRQPWGSARFNVSGSHFLDSVRRNNLSTSGNFNVRLFRGHTLDLSGSYSRVRDQIYIPKGDASDDEVLLRRRALETGYRYARPSACATHSGRCSTMW
jgi:hypothetical protein